jgi:hypothetical protein
MNRTPAAPSLRAAHVWMEGERLLTAPDGTILRADVEFAKWIGVSPDATMMNWKPECLHAQA